MAWQLASVGGAARYGSASGWSATDSAALATTLADVVRNESDRRSPFYAVGEHVHAWLVVPVVV